LQNLSPLQEYRSKGKPNAWWNVVDKGVHVHDWQATVMHLLGINHELLTYRYQGRRFRLTDVHGHVVEDILT
jgi:hypothetical protein